MLVAVASRKASPGVTTVAALLAGVWPEPVERLLLEADPSGGSLAARWSVAHGLSWDPGLLSLSTNRRPIEPGMLDAVAQPLAEGVWAAAAPPGSDQVVGGLTRLGDPGAAALAASDVVVIADCGRLDPRSPAMPLAARAALTLVVCRPRLDEVNALVPGVAEFEAAGCQLGLVTIGQRPYAPSEVARSLGIELVGTIADDPRPAGLFAEHGLGAGRAFRRSAMLGDAAELAVAVHGRCQPRGGAPTPAAPPGPVESAVPRKLVPIRSVDGAPGAAPPARPSDAGADPAPQGDPRVTGPVGAVMPRVGAGADAAELHPEEPAAAIAEPSWPSAHAADRWPGDAGDSILEAEWEAATSNPRPEPVGLRESAPAPLPRRCVEDDLPVSPAMAAARTLATRPEPDEEDRGRR